MNLFDLMCKISVDSREYEDGLRDAQKETKSFAKNAGDSVSSFANKAGNALKAIAKVGAAAVGAAATGIGVLLKYSITAYADFEQLVGGVETLFGQSAKRVQEYASDAYKTAGLSANEYMETVTGFSASLLQSLSGDTVAAAEKANTAITDMSDNANKMGTDMSSIQTAYQGFAKQNYTMLDNLKLGYGGTKEEMQRLIDDANRLNAAQGKLTQYSIDSYADIVDAIHDVQTEMGITGTTAREASTTIQGSVSAVKSAWNNLMVGIADDNQDFGSLVDNFVDSLYTAADNILPRVDVALDGILRLVEVASKKIVPRVIKTISDKAPELLSAASDIVIALGDGIVDNFDSIFGAVEKTATKIIPKLSKAFADLAPKIAASALKIVNSIDGTAISVGGLYGSFKSLLSGNWIGAGIGLFVSALGLAKKAADDNRDAVYGLTEEEKRLRDAAEEAADVMAQSIEVRDDNIIAIMDETQATQDLWDELQTLVDENGNVLAGNQERVDFILGELNSALGTEYDANGGIISQYQQMQDEIDNLIAKRRVQLLLENGEATYQAALKNRDALVDGIATAEKAVTNASIAYQEAARRLDEANKGSGENYDMMVAKEQEALRILQEAQLQYDTIVAAASSALTEIDSYEQAMLLAAQGRYSEAATMMTQDTTYRWKHVEDIKKINEAERQQLKSDLDLLRQRVETFRTEYEKGTDGFTKPMLTEMEAALGDLAKMWTEATGEAYDCGTNLAQNLQRGFQSSSSALINGIGATVNQLTGLFQNINTTNTTTSTGGRKPSKSVKYADGEYDTAVATPAMTRSVAENHTPINISISVHADTEDLGKKIAEEVETVMTGVIQSMGVGYKGGRTAYAY